MRIKELRGIVRKESPVYYRRFYSGTIVFEIMGAEAEREIRFSVETLPDGGKEFSFTLDKGVDYPKVDLFREIKAYLNEHERNLPL
jgi:hypothetical protein